MLSAIYNRLPPSARPTARRWYHIVHPSGRPEPQIEIDFIESCITSQTAFESYAEAFESDYAREVLQTARVEMGVADEPSSGMGGIDDDAARRLYTFIRDEQPQTVVETGVCNGISTFHYLRALSDSKAGSLYSIDYPFYADEDRDEFRAQTC